MRLIDADELRKKSTHARDIARYDGDLLVIGLGYLLDAPTHDADKLRVALEGLYNAVAKQRYAEGSELMDAWKAAGDVLGISETQTDKDKKWAEPSITPIAALQELYKEIKDATEVARALRDVLNRTTAEVAWALYYDLDLDPADTAKALRDGLGLDAAEVAKALYYDLDLDSADTAKALRDVLDLSDAEVAKALRYDLDLTAEDVAKALHSEDGLDLDAAEVAWALYSPSGLGLDAAEVAKVMKVSCGGLNPSQLDAAEVAKVMKVSCGGLNPSQIAKALRDGLSLSVTKIAHVLYSEDDLSLSAADVAKALRDGLGLDAAEVAWALYSPSGLGLSAEEVAKALYSRDGLNLSAAKVAKALRDDLNLFASEVSAALKGAGIDPEPSYKTASELKAEKKGNQTGIRR